MKGLCLTPGGPASMLMRKVFFPGKCVRQKAHGWESAGVIVGKRAIPKDLM